MNLPESEKSILCTDLYILFLWGGGGSGRGKTLPRVLHPFSCFVIKSTWQMLFASICRMAELGGITELTWRGVDTQDKESWYLSWRDSSVGRAPRCWVPRQEQWGCSACVRRTWSRDLHTVLSPEDSLCLGGKFDWDHSFKLAVEAEKRLIEDCYWQVFGWTVDAQCCHGLAAVEPCRAVNVGAKLQHVILLPASIWFPCFSFQQPSKMK